MSRELPSLDAQAARYRELSESIEAKMIRRRAMDLIRDARYLGLRIEITQVSHAQAMGATHEVATVTPSREGYQSAI